jgi:hypothetical protein
MIAPGFRPGSHLKRGRKNGQSVDHAQSNERVDSAI